MPRSMATMPASSTGGPGRAAMSVSFSFAVIMRRVETRAASPARMAVFRSSVKRLRRSMAASSGGSAGI